MGSEMCIRDRVSTDECFGACDRVACVVLVIEPSGVFLFLHTTVRQAQGPGKDLRDGAVELLE